MMEIGAVVAGLGLVLTIIAFVYEFADTTPAWLSWYDSIVNRPSEGDYNLFVVILGPILLVMGGFYIGEQVMLRRRFDELLDTSKKSEFTARRRDLQDLARRLPDDFRGRIEAKENEFRAKRT